MSTDRVQIPIIRDIKIDKLYHLNGVVIEPDAENPHIILTGKNGSGKTQTLRYLHISFVHALYGLLDRNQYEGEASNVSFWSGHRCSLGNIFEKTQASLTLDIKSDPHELLVKTEGLCELTYHILMGLKKKISIPKLIVSYRSPTVKQNIIRPDGIKKLNVFSNDELKRQGGISGYNSEEGYYGRYFLQFLVNLKAQFSFARDDGDHESVAKIDEWFKRFETRMCEIFEDPQLKLEFQRKEFNFLIHRTGQEPCEFNELSDGYQALFQIVADIMMQMEANQNEAYDLPGVVFIDEIDAHLHVSLQKLVLPFLTSFFPRIQFIVTTHSPFVLQSIENATVYDLEKHIQVKDLELYSYEGILEGYYGVDQYAEKTKQLVTEYQALLNDPDMTPPKRVHLKKLYERLKQVPAELAPELYQLFQASLPQYQEIMAGVEA